MMLNAAQKMAINELLARFPNGIHESQFVKFAEDPKSPLHDLLTWNNREAGRKLRLQEARRILRELGVDRKSVVKKNGKRSGPSLPKLENVSPREAETKVWIERSIAIQDEFMRRQMIAPRIAKLRSAISSLRAVPELRELADTLSAMVNMFRVPVKAEAEKPKLKGKASRARASTKVAVGT